MSMCSRCGEHRGNCICVRHQVDCALKDGQPCNCVPGLREKVQELERQLAEENLASQALREEVDRLTELVKQAPVGWTTNTLTDVMAAVIESTGDGPFASYVVQWLTKMEEERRKQAGLTPTPTG